jgi:TRAP-type C4-dicarboxylate transport system permease small subunit
MHPQFERIDRWICALEALAMSIAAMSVLAIMLIIAADVAARYFFSAPFSWSYDFISLYLVVASFFFALSATLRSNHHINVDMLFRRISVRTGHWLYAIGYVMSSVGIAAIAYGGAERMVVALQQHEVNSGVIEWPTWIGFACVAFGAGLLMVRIVYRAVAHTTCAVSGWDAVAGIRSPADVAGGA